MQDLTGAVIGQYEIVEKLGRGGMANVYKAFHAELAVHRAIKVIRPDLSGSKSFEERFRREARAVAGLRHPNIVQLHDFGRQDDLFYMVMEFVDGEDLKAKIRREGPVRPLEESVRIAVELARALGYAHELNVLHRDAKPDNVMIAVDGQVILTDFGIAKVLGSEDPQLTATGAEIGTPNYMAPELVMGKVQASRSSDLYAVGMVLYEMLTAEAPFAADTPLAVLHRVLHDPVTPPREFQPDIPEGLQAAVLKAMAFEVEDRYESAEALIAGIERGLRGDVASPTGAATRPMLDRSLAADRVESGEEEPASSRPAPPVPPTVLVTGSGEASPRGGRDRWIAGGAVLLLLLLLGASGVWGWRWLRNRDAPSNWRLRTEQGVRTASAGEAIGSHAASERGSSAASRSAPVGGDPLASDAEDPGAPSNGAVRDRLDAAPPPPATVGEADAAPSVERVEPQSWTPPALAVPAPAGEPAEPLASPDGAVAADPAPPRSRAGARDRAGLGADGSGVQPLPHFVDPGPRTFSGGKLYFGEPVAGELDPEDTVVYDLEVRRPTYIYFDIVYATRPATYTLFDARGGEVFRQGSDLGPFRIEEAGWYRLSVETDADIPIRYEIQFLQVGG